MDVTKYRETIPVAGKSYAHIEATSRIGTRLYSENTPRKVGTYVHTLRSGSGDGMSSTAVFMHEGAEVLVNYSYQGFTCFIEL